VNAAVAALLIKAAAAWGQYATGAIAGRLVDHATHEPVVGAQVFVLGFRRPAVSDSGGAFMHRGLPPGTNVVQIRRIGYVQHEWAIRVREGEIVEVLFELEPVAFLLPPTIVEGNPEDVPTWFRGFEERRTARRGQFVTRQEIERQNPSSTLGDVLRHLNGLGMRCDRTGCAIRMTRWSNCQPLYYQDGLPVFATTAERFFAFDIHGVEVYGLSEVPLEFQRPGLRCGVIAIWTRRGPPPRQAPKRPGRP
jgi:hypothetical protein